MAGKQDQLSDDEIDRYDEWVLATLDTLETSLIKLKQRRKYASDQELAEIAARRLEIAAEKHLIETQDEAFDSNQRAIEPPDQATVDRTVQLSRNVTELQVRSAQASAFVQIATEAIATSKGVFV